MNSRQPALQFFSIDFPDSGKNTAFSKLTEIFNKKSSPDETRLNLAKWYNEVEKFDSMEFNKVLDTFSNHNTTNHKLF